jgi:hypothetical protein
MSISTLARRPRRASPGNAGAVPETEAATGTPRDNFDALTRYIPTETITIFVAAAGAMNALKDVWPGVEMWMLYTGCAVLTPLIYWAVAYGRHNQANDGTPFRFAIWEPVAATIAFLVWALSVPGVLALADPKAAASAQTLAAVAAVLVSALLSLVEAMLRGASQN